MFAMAACGSAPKSPPPQSPQTQYGQPGQQVGTAKAATTESQRSIHEEADEAMAPRPVQPGATAGAPPPPAAAPPAERAPDAPAATDPRARYARANVQLSEARRQLDVAAGQRDCANACRALESMERAAGQICELARSTEERRTCRAAEDQVGSARERVKNACGECPKRH